MFVEKVGYEDQRRCGTSFADARGCGQPVGERAAGASIEAAEHRHSLNRCGPAEGIEVGPSIPQCAVQVGQHEGMGERRRPLRVACRA